MQTASGFSPLTPAYAAFSYRTPRQVPDPPLKDLSAAFSMPRLLSGKLPVRTNPLHSLFIMYVIVVHGIGFVKLHLCPGIRLVL